MKVGVDEKNCLEADNVKDKVLVKTCDSNEAKQKWKWGKMYEDNLRNWDNVGAKKMS